MKCPYCGSYDTDPVIINYVGRGALHAGRFLLAGGAALVGGLFGHNIGHMAGHSVLENTKPGDFKGHRCNKCKKEF